MRLTKEREAEIRAHAEVDGCDGVDDLLAELDAVRAERDAAHADERAAVVAWLNRRANELDAATRGDGGSIDAYKADAYDAAADAIERGEHEVKP